MTESRQAAYNRAVHEMHRQMAAPSWSPSEPKPPFPWGFTIGWSVMAVLILGWALLISLGNMEQTERLNARGCERVFDPQDPRLAGKVVDMSKEVWACRDGGIVYR